MTIGHWPPLPSRVCVLYCADHLSSHVLIFQSVSHFPSCLAEAASTSPSYIRILFSLPTNYRHTNLYLRQLTIWVQDNHQLWIDLKDQTTEHLVIIPHPLQSCRPAIALTNANTRFVVSNKCSFYCFPSTWSVVLLQPTTTIIHPTLDCNCWQACGLLVDMLTSFLSRPFSPSIYFSFYY